VTKLDIAYKKYAEAEALIAECIKEINKLLPQPNTGERSTDVNNLLNDIALSIDILQSSLKSGFNPAVPVGRRSGVKQYKMTEEEEKQFLLRIKEMEAKIKW